MTTRLMSMNTTRVKKKITSTLALLAFMAVLAVSVSGTSFGVVTYIVRHNESLAAFQAGQPLSAIAAPDWLSNNPFFLGR